MVIRSGSSWRGAFVALLGLHAAQALAQRDPDSGAPLPPAREDAGTPSPITDRFSVEGIYYGFHVDTGLRVDPQGVPDAKGTPLHAEGDLGLASHLDQGRVRVMMRMRRNSRAWVDFEDVDRSGSAILSAPLQIGDQLFAAGQRLDSNLSWRVLTVGYTYSLFHSDSLEVGLGAAIHVVQARARSLVAATGQSEDVSTVNPFPAIPIDVTWRFARRFSATARVQYFNVTLANFSGSWLDLHGDVQYRWTPNFSVGVGYTLERVPAHLDTSEAFAGALTLNTRGGEAFFRVSL